MRNIRAIWEKLFGKPEKPAFPWAQNHRIWFMAMFVMAGLAFAQGTQPLTGYDVLLSSAVVGGALLSLLPFATVALTQFLKETLGLSGNVVKVINGLVNAIFTGFTSWVLANYTGGWKAAGLWVIGSVLAYAIDQGWIKRINQDNQARAALVGQAVKGGL